MIKTRPQRRWEIYAFVWLTGLLCGVLAKLGWFWTYFNHLRIWLNLYSYVAVLPFSIPVNALIGPNYFSLWWPHLLAYAASGLLWFWKWHNYRKRLAEASQMTLAQPDTAPQPEDEHHELLINRRQLLTGMLATASFPALYGWQVERFQVEISRHRFQIRNLDPSLEELRIVVCSDWHCGQILPQAYLERCIEQVNALKPDLVLLPGDFVLGDKRYFEHAADLVKGIKPAIPHGILGTWGNHDHANGLEYGYPPLSRAGLTILSNQALRLDCNRQLQQDLNGSGICLAGADDLWYGKCSLAKTLEGVPPDLARLVMAHNPDTAERQSDNQLNLMISGHTHGGQVRVPLLGAPLVPSDFGSKYLHGIVLGPNFPVMITRGLGVTGLPIRIGAPPEISLLTLTAHPIPETSDYSSG
jgi:predicted MPP superfamily phosphohydrolase